jgi:large subunit ribosomal protein L23
MKLIRPIHEQPKNVIQFECSMEMTKYDVKQYLEKIYKLPVVEVRTRIDMGKTKRDAGVGYVVKEEDAKIAYVTLVGKY